MAVSILISGSSGMVGSHLVKGLRSLGHKVYKVNREPTPLSDDFFLNIKSPENSDKLPPGEIVWINLNGAGIADKKWTTKRKKLLFQSRVETTQAITSLCQIQKRVLKIYIGASATGVYGIEGHSYSFLQEICMKWEEAHQQVPSSNNYILRLPIILSPKGGALKKMKLPFELGLGGPLGSGKQLFPWVHLDDIVDVILALSTANIQTQNNVFTPLVLPVPTQGEFAKELGRFYSRPAILPLPRFVAKILFGEMGQEALLGSPKIPKELSQEQISPIPLKYTNLQDALKRP